MTSNNSADSSNSSDNELNKAECPEQNLESASGGVSLGGVGRALGSGASSSFKSGTSMFKSEMRVVGSEAASSLPKVSMHSSESILRQAGQEAVQEAAKQGTKSTLVKDTLTAYGVLSLLEDGSDAIKKSTEDA